MITGYSGFHDAALHRILCLEYYFNTCALQQRNYFNTCKLLKTNISCSSFLDTKVISNLVILQWLWALEEKEASRNPHGRDEILDDIRNMS